MEVASHFKKPLYELLRDMPQREFEMWVEWLSRQWDRPNRTDWYLMQIAARIIQVKVKDPTKHPTSSQKIEFERKSSKPDKPDPLGLKQWEVDKALLMGMAHAGGK